MMMFAYRDPYGYGAGGREEELVAYPPPRGAGGGTNGYAKGNEAAVAPGTIPDAHLYTSF